MAFHSDSVGCTTRITSTQRPPFMQGGGGKGKTHQPNGASKESGLGHLPFQNADTVPTNASDDDDARPRRGSATPVALLGCVKYQILGTTPDSGAMAPEQLAVHGRLVR